MLIDDAELAAYMSRHANPFRKPRFDRFLDVLEWSTILPTPESRSRLPAPRPDCQAEFVAEQLVLRAAAGVGLAVIEDLPHAFPS